MAKKKITLEDDILNMLEDLKQLAKDKGIKVTLSEDSSKTIITLEKKDKSELRKDRKGRPLQNGESQRLDGRYVYQYTDDNGRRCSFYAKDLPELREKEAQLAQDKHDGIDTYRAGTVTVDDYFEKYLTTKNCRETTLTGIKYCYNHYLKNRIGDKKISTLVKSDIQVLYIDLLKTISIGSLKSINGVLHPMLEMAVDDNIIRKNPTSGVIKSIANNYNKPEKRTALSVEEQEIFIDFAKKDKGFSPYMPFTSFLLGTGCRFGEAAGLTWKDIDFETGVIHIDHTLSYRTIEHKSRFIINPTKTQAGTRDISMTASIRKVLRRQQELQMKLGKSIIEIDGTDGKRYKDFVFTGVSRKPLINEAYDTTLYRLIDKINNKEIKDAKKEDRQPVKFRRISAHILRHTFCTNLCQIESDLKAIQETMGHANIQITMDVYADATPQAKKNALEKYDAAYKIG